LCEQILETREQILMHHLGRFKEGIIASILDSLDRIQHMFWQSHPDVVDAWYVRLDALVGRIEQRLKSKGRGKASIFVLSDHGFTSFDHKVHLNRWLIEHGYLTPHRGIKTAKLQDVDWSKSCAYALGLNSIYLNLEGREEDQELVEERLRSLGYL
jgi:predicted AlkP superfamily phosphohydrolase/phosphomutase